MAYNDISKNYTYENGGTIDGDLALTTMAADTKIKNTSSGQLYAKRSGFTNVFDKTNTYANYLKADEFGINTSGSGNGVASITYSSSGRKITQNLTTFTTPSDLATANDNLKSQAVGSISVSGRTVTYKNVNGQPLGSFQTQDNNTTYSAGSGLSLSGTTFSLALTGSHITNALGYTPARPEQTLPQGVFDVGSTVIRAAPYDERFNYGTLTSHGYFHGWCPDNGGGAIGDETVVYMPGTWVICCGTGNPSNIRGVIMRRIA